MGIKCRPRNSPIYTPPERRATDGAFRGTGSEGISLPPGASPPIAGTVSGEVSSRATSVTRIDPSLTVTSDVSDWYLCTASAPSTQLSEAASKAASKAYRIYVDYAPHRTSPPFPLSREDRANVHGMRLADC